MMICARCDKTIQRGEKALPLDKFSESGGGITIYVHARPCTRPPTQTAPTGS